MFARSNALHHQVAYVTNSLEGAMEVFKRDYAAPGFFEFTNAGTGVSNPGDPQLRIALSQVGGVEIELIEPIGDTAPLFKDVLPAGPELKIQFHHVCIRIEGPLENWNAHQASIDTEKHKVVFCGQLAELMRFFYTDERARLGHYVEHVWMAPALLDQMRATIPRFPV